MECGENKLLNHQIKIYIKVRFKLIFKIKCEKETLKKSGREFCVNTFDYWIRNNSLSQAVKETLEKNYRFDDNILNFCASKGF